MDHFSTGDVDAFGGNVEPDKMQGWMDRKWTFNVGRLARIDLYMEPCLAIAHNAATGGNRPDERWREGPAIFKSPLGEKLQFICRLLFMQPFRFIR